MRLSGSKNLNALLRTLLVCGLAVFLVLPESVRAHPDTSSVGVSVQDNAHSDVHDADAVELPDHCHPGLECLVTAVLALWPVTRNSADATPAVFSPINQGRKGWLMSFDPPPPRARS